MSPEMRLRYLHNPVVANPFIVRTKGLGDGNGVSLARQVWYHACDVSLLVAWAVPFHWNPKTAELTWPEQKRNPEFGLTALRQPVSEIPFSSLGSFTALTGQFIRVPNRVETAGAHPNASLSGK